MNSSTVNSSTMNSSRVNNSIINYHLPHCSISNESFTYRTRETFKRKPSVSEGFLSSGKVHQDLNSTSMSLGSAYQPQDSNPHQPSHLRSQDVAAVCSHRSSFSSSNKRSFHSTTTTSSSSTTTTSSSSSTTTTTFKDFDHIPHKHLIHRKDHSESRSQSWMDSIESFRRQSCLFPSHQSSSPNRLVQLNHEEEMDQLSQGRAPKVKFPSSFLNKDDEPVPVKRFRDSGPSPNTRCKKSNRVKRSRTQEENRTHSFSDIISFHDVTSSTVDDVTDRKSCRPGSRTIMTTEVKTDHPGQLPDSTSRSYGSRMSCPSADVHVTSGCNEPEVVDFHRKYWSQKMTRLPPRDRIFAEPHWTKTSCIVASYDIYCQDLSGLLIPLRRRETSINQAGHEPRCGKEKEETKDATPMTTDNDEEEKEEKKENREEEREDEDTEAGGGVVKMAIPGDDSSSVLDEEEEDGENEELRDQHEHLFTDFCLRCPGFTILDPSDQLTIIDHGRWSNFVFVSSRHWLPRQQNIIRRHLTKQLRTNSRSLVDLICQRLSRLSQRLSTLDLDVIEEAMLSSLLVIASDFPNLKQPKQIENVRYQILTTFQAYITAKEGSSSDRLSRLLSSVPAIRQVANELHALQRKTKTSTSADDVKQTEDEKMTVVEMERERDGKDPLNPVVKLLSLKLQGEHGKYDRSLCLMEDVEKKEKAEKIENVLRMEEGMQVERKVEMMMLEGEEVEEKTNEKEESEERVWKGLLGKRKKTVVNRKEKEEPEMTTMGELLVEKKKVFMKNEKRKTVETNREERRINKEIKINVKRSAIRSESQSSGVLLGSRLKANDFLSTRTDEKDCLSRLKTFNPIHKGFQQNLKRSNQDSEILRRKLEHSMSTSDVLTEDFIDSILVSTVLAKRFNDSVPNSNVSSETFLGLIARFKG